MMEALFEPRTFFVITMAVFLLGALVPYLYRGLAPTASRRSAAGSYASLLLALVGSAYAAAGAVHYMRSPAPRTTIFSTRGLEQYLPPIRFEIKIDALSAYFLLLIAGFSTVVAIYSLAALRAPHFRRQRRRVVTGFCLLVGSTLATAVANDVFSLIFMLELSTLAFGFLALFRHNQYLEGTAPHGTEEGVRTARLAPQVYMIVSHTSNILLLMALLLLASRPGVGLSFDDLRANAGTLGAAQASGCFLLALAGLGIRAGLTPAHFWVPLVHPSSPTPTHALSLGIVIKIAVYLMYRFFFQFLTPIPWWGYVALVVAVATAVANVWFAAASHDLKTALAYHSVENVGIIVVGLGVALIYSGRGSDRAIAMLGLLASLYHTLNHAVFKGLLYLCTGAIDGLTRQVVEFEKLGGLIARYPWTSAAFMVGTLAICGFPPLNGFTSEWLTLQALLKGMVEPQPVGMLVVIFCTVLLVVSFGLTALCFFKIAGITLLGTPRSPEHVTGRWKKEDAPWAMRAMMLSLAALCLLLGLMPGKVVGGLLYGVADSILTGGPTTTSPGQGAVLSNVDLLSQMILSTTVAFGVLGLLTLTTVLIVGRGRKALRVKPPWNCGTEYEPKTMQYTGAALTFLVRDQWGAAGPQAARGDEPNYMPAYIAVSQSPDYQQVVREFFRGFYNHLISRVLKFSEWVGLSVQNGDIRRYLFYIFIVNLVTLILFLLVEILHVG